MKFICASHYADSDDASALNIIEADNLENAVVKYLAQQLKDCGEDSEYANPKLLTDCLNDIHYGIFEHFFTEDLSYVIIMAIDNVPNLEG